MELADQLAEVFKKLGCHVKRSAIQHADRLEITRASSKAILDIFPTTGTLRPGGKDGPTKKFVAEIIKKYEADPAFIEQTLSPQPSEAPPTDKVERSVDYCGVLLVLDNARHVDAYAELEQSGYQKVSEERLTSKEVEIWSDRDKIIMEGAADRVEQAITMLKRFGARVEEFVSTPFKERVPKLAVRWSPNTQKTSEQRAKELLGRDLYDFLPAHDRKAVESAILILDTEIPLKDMAPIVMPIARAFEGFIGKILVKIGVTNDIELQDPSFSFSSCFDGKTAKAFKAKINTHETMLDGLKQRLKEHRHTHAHSQASKWVQWERSDAQVFLNRVTDDMKVYFKYFKQHFAS